MSFFNKTYNVYAKPLQNNIANEPVFVGVREAMSKNDAIFKVRNNPANKGLYKNDSFFAICQTFKFEEVMK